MMALFISAVLAIAAISGELSTYSLSVPLESHYRTIEFENITVLIEKMPLGQYVSVSGMISRTGSDYISNKARVYKQFFLTDGANEIKVFCLYRGEILNLTAGNRIFVTGRMQKYYDTIEIYTDCSNINAI